MGLNKMFFIVQSGFRSFYLCIKKPKGKLLTCQTYVEMLVIFEIELILGIAEDNEGRGTN